MQVRVNVFYDPLLIHSNTLVVKKHDLSVHILRKLFKETNVLSI